jgi:uncharacterized membrane protein YphA (DoxX/SURF4 family)
MNRNFLRNPNVLFISRLILGAIFIYASFDKALNPLAFAKVIWNYRVTPPGLINIAAVILPWIELLAGVLLVFGFKVRGANLIINGLLVFYIVLFMVTAIRGINVACGCFTTSTTAKSNLILRIIEDIGMLILGMHIFSFYKAKGRVTE